MKKFNRYLITAALPYANGGIHIGHLAGVYIPSDIYSRYLRLKKRDVIFVCGSDEHGVPITLKAKQEKVSPQNIVDKYHNLIKNSFEKFGINFDIYSRTSSKIHHKTSSDFFKKLYDKKEFIEKFQEQFFDKKENQFLADRYITGTCPHCSYEKAYGDQCENCGTSLNATDLINPKSAISGNVPILKETKHWFLPLDKYENFLRKWILEDNKNWKPNVYGQCKSWIDLGLQPRAVSRDLNWGVPIPIENTDGKVLYVWFDAPIGYISATKEFTKDWEKYWKKDDTKLVHFIGKDNIVFHCIIFPIMLKAEGSFILPDNVPANAFLNLENNKISTSQNWAVWLHEYLKDFEGQEDVLRYVLTINAPETKDNNFTWKEFQGRNNNELVAIMGNFINRALVLTKKYFNGKVPEIQDLTDFDKEVISKISDFKNNVEKYLEKFHFRNALKEVMNLARLGNKYLADTEPWKLIKTDKNRVKTILNISLQITTNLSILVEPFLPFTAKKIRNFLNIKKISWEKIGEKDILKANHQINKPKLLFSKIDDKIVDIEVAKLMKIKKDNLLREKKVKPFKENVSFEEFQKMDIRVGTIIEAEKIPRTKKLLKLKIDTGIDKRTVVSGIAEFHKANEIIGKQVAILVNLSPRKIKGIESEGMILMAENIDNVLNFIAPTNNTKNGSEIK
ncbi:MAG: methionine--tRNA ligase [Bacteroidetes bacterium 4572_128]|nr:MAG: methionine--tRNA ligase [Bacteroidetes bacterium 4572_128]